MSRILLFNKPYGVLSQFTDAAGRPTLARYVPVPGVYPAGRLDQDSEGLLVLTDDGRWQHRISHPGRKWAKTYWVQVEGEPGDAALATLREGVRLRDGLTRPAEVERLAPPDLWPRDPAVAEAGTSWLAITLREGRNRQVRRMTAAVGHPTLRLVRVAVGPWTLGDLAPGQWRLAEAPRHGERHGLGTPGHRRRRHRAGRPASAR